MHTTLKNIELLKHFKIKEAAPTCFGLESDADASHICYVHNGTKGYTTTSFILSEV
jgi:hypothetical protein